MLSPLEVEIRLICSRPCSIQPEDRLWCVLGGTPDGKGGGVLCWAYDESDASYCADLLVKAGYRNVHTSKYIDSLVTRR